MKAIIFILMILSFILGLNLGRTLEANDIEKQFGDIKQQLNKQWMSCEKGNK